MSDLNELADLIGGENIEDPSGLFGAPPEETDDSSDNDDLGTGDDLDDDLYHDDPKDIPDMVPGVNLEEEETPALLNVSSEPGLETPLETMPALFEETPKTVETPASEPVAEVAKPPTKTRVPRTPKEPPAVVEMVEERSDDLDIDLQNTPQSSSSEPEKAPKSFPGTSPNTKISLFDETSYRETLNRMLHEDKLDESEKGALHFLAGRESGIRDSITLFTTSLGSTVEALLSVMTEDVISARQDK